MDKIEVKKRADDLGTFQWPLMGYAPGYYMRPCLDCKAVMTHCDKRATQCLSCALTSILATRTDATPVATDVAALVDHFRRMIEACANYVEPTTYIARHPIGEQCKWDTEFPEPDKHQSIDAALARTHRRDKAFIMDMIYMLDGPEQRAALAPFTKGQP